MITIKRKKKRNPIAYCKFHEQDLFYPDVMKKQCGLARCENGEKSFDGVGCPHLVKTNEQFWRDYDMKRTERVIGKQLKKSLKEIEKERDTETIVCAAIKYKTKAGEEGIVTGKSHADCIKSFLFMDLTVADRDMDYEEQGFMTSKDRFVDRMEAAEIAKKAKQVAKDYNGALYSEFVKY